MADRLIRIAVDAMGGDNAPGVLVEGSVSALRTFTDVEITLVGDSDAVSKSLESLLAAEKIDAKEKMAVTGRLHIVHADEIIHMDEPPARAIRTKKNSSIVLANKLCKAGDVEAVISAGNTGAAMAASLLYMGRLAGVLRPAILALFPSKKSVLTVLDVGANTDCKPEHLFQFGVMASIFNSKLLGYDNPRVALLNIGEERGKGNELTDEAYALFEASDLNFVGNIEGRDIFDGKADVVVCDGFVGNVILKFGESFFSFFAYLIRNKIKKNVLRMAGAFLLKPVFDEIKKDIIPDYYGGAPLLGVDGISIICHGNSTPVAIMNAVRVARRLVLEDMNQQIKTELAKKNGEQKH